jgi:hypothetical protein
MIALRHVLHDGGRAAAGFRGHAGDCVTRAIAIGTGLPYSQVYRELYERAKTDLDALNQLNPPAPTAKRPVTASPRTGVPRPIYEPYLQELGWAWTATMRPGHGCKVHLRADELPDGCVLCRISKHLTVVRDGVVYDTHDPTRDGSRCVYGYYQPTGDAVQAAPPAVPTF